MTSIVPIQIVRDAEFQTLGFVTHQRSAMLVFLEHEKYLPKLFANPWITTIIAGPEFEEVIPNHYGLAITTNPRGTFYMLHNHLAQYTDFYWRDFPTEIAPDAMVHPRAYVAEKNVRIGPRTVIEAAANVLERCIVGADVILRSGSTIGSQGFQFERIEGRVLSVAHAGGVRLGDRVEIQANSVISRPIFGGFTTLGDDTKLDNLIHVAHDVIIGQRCFLAANAMIAGSVTVGDDVWIGPSASISSEITIGDGAYITLGSVVTRNVEPGQRVSGNFAIPHDRFIAFIRSIR